MSLISRDADGCKNADKSGSGEVETGRLCSGRRLSLISSTARGLHCRILHVSARAGRENGSFCKRGARWLYCGNAENRTRANRVTDSSGSRAERSHVVKSAKPGKPPPAEPREARREGAGGAQRRTTRFAAGGKPSAPFTQNLRGKHRTSPESFPAERVLPAPRAGERTLSAFLQWENPLRPGIGTS